MLNDDIFLPVLFSLVLEVVHVAARAQIQRILWLPLLGHAHVDQVARVLHDELALAVVAGGDHAATLLGELDHVQVQVVVAAGVQVGLLVG